MPTDLQRIFLLSPASCGGERARLLFSDRARFPLAVALHTSAGAPLGEVFAFLSGLYFRGKLRYAEAFARAPRTLPGVLVITSSRGLEPPEMRVTLPLLREFAGVPIDARDDRYLRPLLRDIEALAGQLARRPRCEVVLLGSIASEKYVEPLARVLGPRLRFPAEFVGRGDMSRGGLLLRSAEDRRELEYLPLLGAARRGSRPVRLSPRPGVLQARPVLARRAP